MLPTNPRAGGLPSAPRSRSVGRSRQDDSSSRDYARERSRERGYDSSRQVRPQRSMASIPNARDRARPPPMPEMPSSSMRSNKSSRNQDRGDYGDYRKPSSDTSSVSSSGSSLLDRMKRPGDTSSRTSFEEDYDEPPKRGRRAGQTMRPKRVVEEQRASYDDDEGDDGNPASGEGYNIWSRVAGVASSLTVNINKAWAANVPSYAGEETPEGQESRLTRAMKAYHLEKARSPEDLPEWLFEEHERRPVARARRAARRDEDDDYDARSDYSSAPRSHGLRDIYDSAASSQTPPPRSRSAASNPPSRGGSTDDYTGPSKATNRLKALRDAKRSAHTGNRSFDSDRVSEPGSDVGEDRERRSHSSMGSNGRRVPPPRAGLPGRPRPGQF